MTDSKATVTPSILARADDIATHLPMSPLYTDVLKCLIAQAIADAEERGKQQALASHPAPERVPTGEVTPEMHTSSARLVQACIRAYADRVPAIVQEKLENSFANALAVWSESAYAKGLSDAAELRLGAWADSVLDWWASAAPNRRWGSFEADNGTMYCELLDLGAQHFEHLNDMRGARLAAARAIAAAPQYDGPKEPGT